MNRSSMPAKDLFYAIPLLGEGIRMAWGFWRQNGRFDKVVFRVIQYHFPSKEVPVAFAKKIKFYIQFCQMYNDWLSAIRGQGMTMEEQALTSYMAACSPLMDGYQDEYDAVISFTSFQHLDHPYAKSAAALLEKITSISKHPESVLESLEDLIVVQNASLAQKKEGNAKEWFNEIQDQKGGLGAILFLRMLQHTPSKEEKSLVYKVGGFIQLTDDIFDVYEDTQEGIQTILHQYSVKEVKSIYLKKVEDIAKGIKKIPSANTDSFLKRLALLAGRGIAGIDYLESIKNGKPWRDFPRGKLIIDMEKKEMILANFAEAGKLWKKLRSI